MSPAPLLAALFLASASFATAAPRYTVIELGDFSFQESVANAINNAGQVVGYSISFSSDGEETYPHAFFYDRGAIGRLPDLGFASSVASGLDSTGRIVGYSFLSDTTYHGFVYANGVMTDLGALGDPASAGSKVSKAAAVNNSGQVVGSAQFDQNRYTSHAFLYANGTMTDLGGLTSFATAINDLGQVVGGRDNHAFLYTSGVMTDLGTLDGSATSFSWANGLNDRGEVVGRSRVQKTAAHAFLYAKGKMVDLGTLGGKDSSANAINARGQVVGNSEIKKAKSSHAFLYENSKMADLNDLLPPSSKWVVQDATGINDSGLIAATGTTKGSFDRHALLLAPIPTLTVLGGEKRVTHQALTTIRGRADRSVTQVTYARKRNRNFFARGTTKWHFVIRLIPGQNVVTIVAHGLGGNVTRRQVVVTRI